jgi:hypothetical protein
MKNPVNPVLRRIGAKSAYGAKSAWGWGETMRLTRDAGRARLATQA